MAEYRLVDNKRIDTPQLCPYNGKDGDKHFCLHPDTKIRYCTWINLFPGGCPLEVVTEK
jgi:hypothetical protein